MAHKATAAGHCLGNLQRGHMQVCPKLPLSANRRQQYTQHFNTRVEEHLAVCIQLGYPVGMLVRLFRASTSTSGTVLLGGSGYR